ncbi:MAG: primosomal protein N' [Clostridia bacterium]|nr:primosomal protein N' [Clostridia bacterium]
MIAKVMLTDAGYALSREFDYLMPEGAEAKVGMRVIVPFGARNNSEEAIITRFAEHSSHGRLKRIKKLVDSEPCLTGEQLSLCFWMQRRYLCTFSQAYKQVRPPRLAARICQWYVLLREPAEDEKVTENQRRLAEALKQRGGSADYRELAELAGIKNLKQTAYRLADLGIIEICENIKDSVGAKLVRKVRLACSEEDGYAVADELYARRAYVQANMLLSLCDCGEMTCAELVDMSEGNYASLNALCDKGLAEIYSEQLVREAYDKKNYTSDREYIPTNEQKPIIEYLNDKIEQGVHERILLRGVTGSGKTEVFLQAIRRCIELGKQAIMLVPEISLTPQMVERFVSRFGNSVAVMHSGLSIGERIDQWNRIKNGEVSVVVGARSAVFAPFDNIGIIILDEEHESSYKSDTAPRYHAAEIAEYRGGKYGAPVLLASATPDVVTYYRALQGEYTMFEMNKRYNESALPKARIVDMRSELFDLHNASCISVRLREEIRLNLERGEKTVLFLNRRGYNTFVSCRQCGEVIQCENCSIAMTYHKNTDKLVCHYCGLTMDNVKVCPSCGSKYVRFFGTGTQKIEDELSKLFPEARILRMDYDTTSKKGGHERILRKFRNGEADILLGTQMVTKGLDFPEVTLVGVLAADTALNVDDFRANEKCFSLITQVCGRAGRGDVAGRAVIQTYQPQNRTINFAKEQNYTAFYENEILYRKRMDYPPFCDIVYILLSGEDERAVEAEICNIGEILKEQTEGTSAIQKIIGPAAAPISRIKNKFRYRIMLKVKQAELILPLLGHIYEEHENSGIKNILSIDINPTNMV